MLKNRRELIDLNNDGLLQDCDVAAAMDGHLGTYYDRASELGERCWRIRGHMFDVVIWDCGNGRCVIQQVILPMPSASYSIHGFDSRAVYGELANFFSRMEEKNASAERDEAAERLEPDPQPQRTSPQQKEPANDIF